MCCCQVLAAEEVEEFAGHASVLLINVGTLTAPSFQAMKAAATAYRQLGKPWVLDPVAAGATKYRLQVQALERFARIVFCCAPGCCEMKTEQGAHK